MGKVYMSSKVVRIEGWGESMSTVCVGKITRNCIQCFLTLVLLPFVHVVF